MATDIDSASEPQERVLTLTRYFAAPRALVFKVWTEPQHLVRWWGPQGYRLSFCKVELEPGGAWRFCMRRQEDGHEHWIHGRYREIEPPERLSFTYINDVDGHEMLVTLRFTEEGEGTRMDFRQSLFFSQPERDGHNYGWSSSLDRLADYLLPIKATS